MSLKLYFAPGACSFVPHVLLEMSGAEFEPSMVKLHKGEQNSAEYQAINPRAQVPVLVSAGQPITQILAIVLHLDQIFPQIGFFADRAHGPRPGTVHAGLDEQHRAPHIHAHLHAAKVL